MNKITTKELESESHDLRMILAEIDDESAYNVERQIEILTELIQFRNNQERINEAWDQADEICNDFDNLPKEQIVKECLPSIMTRAETIRDTLSPIVTII